MSTEVKQHNIYRTKTDKVEGGIKIPRAIIEREDIGLQYIDYFLGGKSYWVDENVGREVGELYLDETDGVSPLQLIVPANNKVLNEYLQIHPMFNSPTGFELYSADIEAERSIASHTQIKEAFKLIDESDPIRVQSIALAVYGMSAYGKSFKVCLGMLSETAATKPHTIIESFKKPDYESYFLAAHAYYSGIVKDNEHSTAVIYADGLSAEITTIPVGESGVEVLGRFLANNTEHAKATLQTIGQKLDAMKANLKPAVNNITVNDATQVSASDLTWEQEVAGMDLLTAQRVYVEKTGKNLSLAYANNLDWIKGKLLEIKK